MVIIFFTKKIITNDLASAIISSKTYLPLDDLKLLKKVTRIGQAYSAIPVTKG